MKEWSFLSVLFILLIYLQTVNAHENISIIDINHHLIKERYSGGHTIRTFIINITLANDGDSDSGNISVNIKDSEGFILNKTVFLSPAEIKVVSFEWSTAKEETQTLNISYAPTSVDAAHASYNSGFTEIVIEGIASHDTSQKTPGFEIILFFVATVLLLMGKRFR